MHAAVNDSDVEWKERTERCMRTTDWETVTGAEKTFAEHDYQQCEYMYKGTCFIIFVTIESHTTKSSEETEL